MALANKATKQEPVEAKLVGTVRRAGTFGPFYEVVAIKNGEAEIQFPESNQTAHLSIEAVLEDPLKE